MLSEFEECVAGVIVEGRCKTHLQSLKKTRPRGQLIVTEHPLKPAEGWPVKVERGDLELFVVRGTMVVKKLTNLEYPRHGINPVEARNLKVHTGRWGPQ